MPTVSGIPSPYRFYFFSHDCDEVPHIHVRQEAAECKFSLQPVAMAYLSTSVTALGVMG